jgi:hypothetical protein
VFTDILRIKPQLDDKDLNAMDRKLSGRFSKIAKGFGKGLKLAAGLALGASVLDKLINPLQEVKAAIDRTLGKADDIVTNAGQFNTSTRNMVKLRALGDVNGLAPEQLDILLTKFQGAVAQYNANPKDESVSSVANFANEKDIAVGFFSFITSLQKMNKEQQVLVQSQIFGEKQILKMAEFLQANFEKSAETLKKVDFDKVAKSTEKLANLEQIDRNNKVIRGLNDLNNKAGVINKGTLANVNKSEINALTRENGQIARSAAAFTAEENIAKMTENFEKLANELLTAIPEIFSVLNGISNALKQSIEGWRMIIDLIKKSPLMRGIGDTLKKLNPFGSDE